MAHKKIHRMSHKHLGAWGERTLVDLLASLGIEASIRTSGPDLDVTINGRTLTVEVKTSRITRNGAQACLFKERRGGVVTDAKRADVLVWIVVSDDQMYFAIMPTCEIGELHKIEIGRSPAVYRGKWARFFGPLARFASIVGAIQ